MCFSRKLSMLSFLFGLFSSLMLIIYGNKEYYKTNLAIGYFFIFVSLMQLIEYFIWSDLDCKNGLNKLGSLLGPLFNHFQPLILLLLGYLYLKSNNFISMNIVYFLNIIYIYYVLYIYFIVYMKKNNLCVGLNKNNHLDWNWKYSFNYLFYYIIVFINVINYINNKNILIVLLISLLLNIFTYYKFNLNIGEFWSLFVTGIPLLLLFIQKVLL
jgi:hypothetical protein